MSEILKDKQIFYFRIPTQIRYLFENPEQDQEQEIGEVVINKGQDEGIFLKINKRQKQDSQSSLVQQIRPVDYLGFKCQEMPDQAQIKYLMKEKLNADFDIRYDMYGGGRSSQSMNKNRRNLKAKLKKKLNRQMQLLPQQFVKSIETPAEMVSIEEITKPPEVIIAQSIFDISDKNVDKDEDRRNFINIHGQIKQQTRDRRVARSEQELKEEIFQLFQRRRCFTLEDMLSILNQPREPVKRILDSICEFNRGNREYELKRSYL
ncbi:UNKNOWN [Stylonychia lemnae]|uniref:TFIIF beta subunit HTH domain-containing protein n=1 Tax=Stylonychia lemnae TaxID=5949 RepID=A0A078AEL2_STYLE|nr:UNKNOWN [Stylonychia lemnae]|eukprot:CDW79348.1 UNKNOWN [Stylonychia lemnae]